MTETLPPLELLTSEFSSNRSTSVVERHGQFTCVQMGQVRERPDHKNGVEDMRAFAGAEQFHARKYEMWRGRVNLEVGEINVEFFQVRPKPMRRRPRLVGSSAVGICEAELAYVRFQPGKRTRISPGTETMQVQLSGS